MFSERLRFSLASLAVLIGFGFFRVCPFASANDGATAHVSLSGVAGKSQTSVHIDFSVDLIAAELMRDVSYRGDGADDNIQIMRSATQTDITISLLVRFGAVVNLDDPTDARRLSADQLKAQPGIDVRDLGTPAFEATDIVIDAYDAQGRSLGKLPLTEANDVVELRHRDPTNPGKEFLILIAESKLSNAYSAIHSGGPFAITTLLISIPPQKVQDASLEAVLRKRRGEHEPHWNTYSNVFQVHFVAADDGAAKYKTGPAFTTDAGAGVPGVVSIDRLLYHSPFIPIETGPFTVKVILTEEPRSADNTSGLTPDMVDVINGEATHVSAGLTYKAGTNANNAGSALTVPVVGEFYTVENDVPKRVTTLAALPNATGRDNTYYTYFVEITPDPGHQGHVTVSIARFMDHKKPISNVYVPLTPAQRGAITLGPAAAAARDVRIMNETLTVQVDVAPDTTSDAARLAAAYEARQKDKGDTEGIFDKNPNLKALPEKAVIPAGGYLVLATGKDTDASGILNSPEKVAEKFLPVQKRYNITYAFSLPYPAANLADFFRNGGTLTLAYKDIPLSTTAKNAAGAQIAGTDDAIGYKGANSTAYTKGSVVISEIMWGLDKNETTRQYIELQNTTDTSIGIDKLEWVLAVGEPPMGFTVIDTVSNMKDPMTGNYWIVPGSSGVTVADAAHPKTSPLISMSRVTLGDALAADGTAQLSWAASVRPSVNLSRGQIGTPGTDNNFDTSAQDAEKAAAAAAAKTPTQVAQARDLIISEIMVDSNQGGLPQWIEIANVSRKEVSLRGWSLRVENDPADTDVVVPSVDIELGDVIIGKDQVLLVVARKGRNSGTSRRALGNGAGIGDLDENRIVDVQNLLRPKGNMYSLLSKRAFRIALLPPHRSAVGRGDVVGNLGMAWNLPTENQGTARSSLIRRRVATAKIEIHGTDAAAWVRASDTTLVNAYTQTYYGYRDDIGTPGYNAGGPLPVELSNFNAARERLTDTVVITWETQSELNNAGFFIKRSQQKNGQFTVVNPTMIAGAGTTSEKQFYTYTDTTAQPNIVYYYQIEDVSLDGNRQTLTRGIRLKGHNRCHWKTYLYMGGTQVVQ